MVQIVDWSDTNVKFEEGPFVISQHSRYWAILCEIPEEDNEPKYPSTSVVKLCNSQKKKIKFNSSKKEITAVCDWLNGLVIDGKIFKNKYWVAK